MVAIVKRVMVMMTMMRVLVNYGFISDNCRISLAYNISFIHGGMDC